MYCDRCGRPVNNGTTLCPYCGQYLPPSRHAEMIGPPSPQRMQQYYSGNYHHSYGGSSYRRRRSGGGCLGGCATVIGIMVVLVVAGFIIAVIALGPGTGNRQETTWPSSSSSSSSSEQTQTSSDPVVGRWDNTKVEYGSRTYPADAEVYVTFYANGGVVLMVDGDSYNGSWQYEDKQGGRASYKLRFPGRDYSPYCYISGSTDEELVIGVSGGYVMYFSR